MDELCPISSHGQVLAELLRDSERRVRLFVQVSAPYINWAPPPTTMTLTTISSRSSWRSCARAASPA